AKPAKLSSNARPPPMTCTACMCFSSNNFTLTRLRVAERHTVHAGHAGRPAHDAGFVAARECPLYPQKRTSELSRGMSALCQKQTFRPLFDMIDGGCTRGGITMKLPRRRFLHVAVGAAAISAASSVAKAEVYPSRTITMIVPLPPGIGTDALARILAEHMR